MLREACTNERLAEILASWSRQTLRYTQLGLATTARRNESAWPASTSESNVTWSLSPTIGAKLARLAQGAEIGPAECGGRRGREVDRGLRTRGHQADRSAAPLVTEVDRLICGGAHASFLLQTVRVIERFCGPAIARQCARSMLIDVTQTTQTPLVPLLTEKTHNDVLVHRAQQWMQQHMAEPLRMSELADRLAVSERTLIRRFRAVLGAPPLNHLQLLRIDTARALLEAGALSIEQIAGYVGYGDTSSFSRLFRERVGFTPGAYRAKFS